MAKIFIVDDDEDILFSLQYWFKTNGYDVACFSSSKDLLVGLRVETPDVILLDVNLNGEDGRKICRTLKNEHGVKCKIVLFSANPNMLKNYTDYLADAWVEKPFQLTEILTIVEECITN